MSYKLICLITDVGKLHIGQLIIMLTFRGRVAHQNANVCEQGRGEVSHVTAKIHI